MAETTSTSPAILRHPLSFPTGRPPPTDLVASWILEFVLRQPIPDHLAHEIFISLPFSSQSHSFHPHLRKTLLLRRLFSDVRRRSLSESTLLSMELMEELDRLRGAPPSLHLKAAYCAAAVSCTAEALRRSVGDFADAVDRIWLARIADLVRSEAAAGLVSEELVEWGKRMERWRSTEEGYEKLLDRNVEEAVRVVGDYMESAMEEMGPPFLEIAAAEVLENRMVLSGSAEMEGDDLKVSAKMSSCLGRLEDCGIGEKHDGSAGAMEDDGIQERSKKGFDNAGVREVSEVSGSLGENVTGQDTTGGGVSHKLDPGEVSKVKEALKKSCFDLKMLFEDPLPEAEANAATVLASMAGDDVLLNETVKHSSKGNTVLPVSPVAVVARVSAGMDSSTSALEKEKSNLVPDFVQRKPLDSKPSEGDHTVEKCNNDAEPSKHGAIVAPRNLFERNPSAHTKEWSDDSLESSFEKSPAAVGKPHSTNKMTRIISLPRQDKGKFVKRRAIKRWSSLEEQTLREAVAKYGKGNWKFILYAYSGIFEERTEVDLKDKWRNMSRYLA